ncbi:GL14199 [Drosophila persimilis]|uniref:Carbohydrate sulfotransferase n=2 Tax=pseudoobscura subgroup TaxID=32358 RepID=Q29L92_DROPS|nr:carbohydrate sulfotransferase 11 [Drosophila pseudoobscura]XP_002020854.1 carbohydrate sulfotransferase 11 [Drosophila persimilis]XP_017153082.1 carbohydrate sulfotransferase 11 [Drosophila miranda]EDW39847.1 GL14199 [Drosophila persimilis]
MHQLVSLWFCISLVATTIFTLTRCTPFEDGNNNNVKITKRSLELTQTINIQRQEYMQRQCELLGEHTQTQEDLTELQMDHMIVDKQHKLLYCYVPKVACTNWKRVLMLLTGKWHNGTDPLQIPGSLAHSVGMFAKFYDLSDQEKQQVLSEDYTRFILVRHPFERLLSAYRNKLEGDSPSARYFQSRVGRQIVRELRPEASNKSLEHGDDVTFGEFVEYLLTPELSRANQSAYNEHWEVIAKLCNPCVMKYNVVGKYDTLLDDSALALYLAGATNLTFPTGHKPSSTRANLRKYFDPLPIGAIRQLYEIYEEDFRFFDYGMDDVLGFEFG